MDCVKIGNIPGKFTIDTVWIVIDTYVVDISLTPLVFRRPYITQIRQEIVLISVNNFNRLCTIW